MISADVIELLKNCGYVLVSTLAANESIHCSAKGVIEARQQGKVYLIDLYQGNTCKNLKRNPTISITAINESQFSGFTLQGEASIVKKSKIQDKFIEQWEKKLIERISKRLVKNIKKEKKTARLPETKFPRPEYLIEVRVKKVIDLAPANLKKPVSKNQANFNF